MLLRSYLRDWIRFPNALRSVRMFGLLILILVIATSCANEDFIDQITVINDTDYPTRVTVTSGADEAWLALTTAPAHTENVVEEVIDQGQTWIFRFEYIDKYEETAEISRDALEESNWQVEVPESFSDALIEMGLEPPLQ